MKRPAPGGRDLCCHFGAKRTTGKHYSRAPIGDSPLTIRFPAWSALMPRWIAGCVSRFEMMNVIIE